MTLHLRELAPQLRANAASTPFAGLLPLSYDLVLADPPWRFENYSEEGQRKSAAQHYDTMATPDICALPVSELCRGDCILVLWATWSMLDDARRVMRAWGFKQITGGAWFKRTSVNAMPWQGTGYVLRTRCEPFLIGTIGSPLTEPQIGALESFHLANVLDAKVREPSRKPDDIYAMCDALVPRGLKALELFARQIWMGQGKMVWNCWGHETSKFKVGGGAVVPKSRQEIRDAGEARIAQARADRLGDGPPADPDQGALSFDPAIEPELPRITTATDAAILASFRGAHSAAAAPPDEPLPPKPRHQKTPAVKRLAASGKAAAKGDAKRARPKGAKLPAKSQNCETAPKRKLPKAPLKKAR